MSLCPYIFSQNITDQHNHNVNVVNPPCYPSPALRLRSADTLAALCPIPARKCLLNRTVLHGTTIREDISEREEQITTNQKEYFGVAKHKCTIQSIDNG